MNRCNICLEESCKGKYDCHCDSCDKITKCYRILRPTIRITNKCTQECSHCCFSSSPKSDLMMTVESAKNIAAFLENNNIQILNIMGGEFFCNPNWLEILDILIKSSSHSRLVTNGDWSVNESIKNDLRSLVERYKDKVFISVSKDKWHTNKNVDKASEFLEEIGARFNVTKPNEMSGSSIVPVGRSFLSGYGIYSYMSTYCSNPMNRYSFLIDEVGDIYKGSFGVWRYSNVNDYINGGFDKRFKEFNKEFYKIFIPSCKSCYSIYERKI